VACVPAWLEQPVDGDAFAAIARAARDREAAPLLARARELGMPVAPVAQPPVRDVGGSRHAELAARPRASGSSTSTDTQPDMERAPAHDWLRIAAYGPCAARERGRAPFVVDLSSLWAGPLAGGLLAASGARVVKVESTRRPDGARGGPVAFYDVLNERKESVALDFTAAEGRRLLAALVARADVVIESSRPRALAQLGLDAPALVRERRGLVWMSITAYGRAEPMGGWVGFGDDAAAAAGVVAAMVALHGTPLFCGDAVADPLAGMHAALAALDAWRDGRSMLLDVALCAVTRSVLAEPSAAGTAVVRQAPHAGPWEVVADGESAAVALPRARRVRSAAPALGADTARVLAELTCWSAAWKSTDAVLSTCAVRTAASPPSIPLSNVTPARKSSTATAARCCPVFTTTTFTCSRSRPPSARCAVVHHT
jgi:crotonobetainyl-CoA:carnitine CoA-transferase CaiB-like acyl-CoA transferase